MAGNHERIVSLWSLRTVKNLVQTVQLFEIRNIWGVLAVVN